jgi:hypothetical protein
VALKVGDLYVLLSAKTDGLGQGLQNGAEQIERFAKRAKKVSNEFAGVGAAITASVLGIVSKVQSLDPVAHQSFMGFTLASQTLGVQIAHVAVPALNAMGQSLRNVADYLAGLSPQTKQHIADWIVIAAKVGTAALVFGRLMALLKGTAAIFQAVMVMAGGIASVFTALAGSVVAVGEGFLAFGAAVGAIGAGPLLLIAGGIAAIIATVVLLREAWNRDWGGIQEVMRKVITEISGYWTSFVSFLGGLWSGMIDDFAAKAKAMIALFFLIQSAMPGKQNPMAGIQQQAMYTAIDATANVAKDPHALGQLALQAGKAIQAEGSDIVKQFRALLTKLMDEMGLTSKAGAHAPSVMNPEVLKMMEAGQAEVRANALGDAQRGFGFARQQRDYNNIGAPQTAVWAQMTQGFTSFDDALKKESAALQQQAQLSSAAKMMELKAAQFTGSGQYEAARAALDSAENLKLLALQSGETAEKAKEAADALSKIKEEEITKTMGALKMLGDSFIQNTGKLGQTISAGIQGFQQGGVWGAMIAVIMQFVTSAKGWTEIMNIGNGQFQMALNDMAKGLGDLFSGLKPLMGAIESIAKAIHQVLNPVFTLLGVILKGIAPIFEVVGVALQVVAGTLGPLIQIIGGILDPLFKLMGLTLSPLVIAFMYLKVAVDGIALGFNMLIDWIDRATGLGNNQGGVDSASAQFEADKASADQFALNFLNDPFGAIGTLENQSADTAAALGNLGNTANTVSQQLLNVPQGFKVALAELAATQAVGTSSSGGSGHYSQIASEARQRFLMTSNPVAPGRYPRKK